VAEWAEKRQVEQLPNIKFIRPETYISSYDLIRMAKFVMVYNSTIGLEATLLGKPVLAGGKARLTQLETSFYPASTDEYNQLLEKMLTTDKIEVPLQFRHNARRFLYYQLYATSLEFGDFVEDDRVWKGYVKLKVFPLDQLKPERSPTIRSLLDGILHEGDFTNLT